MMDTLETAAIEKRRKEVSFFKEHGCQPMNLKGYGFVDKSMETKPTEYFLYQKSNIKEQSGHELKNNPGFSVINGKSFCKLSTQQLPLGPGNNVNGSSQKEPGSNVRRTQKCYEAIPSKLSPGFLPRSEDNTNVSYKEECEESDLKTSTATKGYTKTYDTGR